MRLIQNVPYIRRDRPFEQVPLRSAFRLGYPFQNKTGFYFGTGSVEEAITNLKLKKNR